MEIEIYLTRKAIPELIQPPPAGAHGAWLEFRGAVRNEENGKKISALEYEAYPEMATREIRRLLEEISSRHPCLAAEIIHRLGTIPVGETAIYVGIASAHRAEAIAFLAEFMDKLKKDVPIWKTRAVPDGAGILPATFKAATHDSGIVEAPQEPPSERGCVEDQPQHVATLGAAAAGAPLPRTQPRSVQGVPASLDEALARISTHCTSLPAIALPLDGICFGHHILRETVFAPTDFPDCDRSTRDGYAILRNDSSTTFQIVDAIHAADWKPRQLEIGQAVRVATGASLPCANMRVIMQEDVERNGDQIRVLKPETDFNIRRRGEEIKAGAPLVQAGEYLDAGKIALLASAGCVRPVVSPRLHVFHFTTGDEIVPPYQTPKPGQIRDSNSFLIRGLLQQFRCGLFQDHLREDFELATTQIANRKEDLEKADVLLFSGGASVGDKDFTRPLLESLGFEIVFSKAPIRPGRPTIFGVKGRKIAFGLPGNPLAHFVCFHLFVAPALALLAGGRMPGFLRGRLAERLDDAANPRETLWPARLELADGQARLHPLAWHSSGDVTCLTEANALLRVPPDRNEMEPGAEIEFLPANGYQS